MRGFSAMTDFNARTLEQWQGQTAAQQLLLRPDIEGPLGEPRGIRVSTKDYGHTRHEYPPR